MNAGDEEKRKLVKVLRKYFVTKNDRKGKRIQTFHNFLAKHDLVEFLGPELTPNMNYVNYPESLFGWLSAASAPLLLGFLQTSTKNKNFQIMNEMSFGTLEAILDVPEEISKQILDEFVIEDSETFSNRKNANLKQVITLLKSFRQLQQDGKAKLEVSNILFEELKTKKAKPFKLFKLAIRDFRTGSKQSKKLLNALSQLKANAIF